jgi:adenylate cyclase
LRDAGSRKAGTGLLTSLLVKAGLRFADPAEEAAFFGEVARYRYFAGVALMLGAAIFYMFHLWDPIIDPVHADAAYRIRVFWVCPLVLLSAVLVLLPGMGRFYEPAATFGTVAGGVGMSVICATLDRGIDYGAAGILLVMLFVFSMVPLRIGYFLIFCAAIGAAFWAAHILSGNYSPGMPFVNVLLVGTGIFLGILSAVWRERQARRQFHTLKQLAQSHVRVEELLHSMLPPTIVDRIQSGETMIADEHREVSIVFSDLVGFTDLSRRVSATELITILNGLFSRFDAAAEQHGMHKIKTIGDAYMAVGGITGDHPRETHCERAALFAFAMQRAVAEVSIELDVKLDIRVGLHIGPVVAGVIGKSRPAFDCWGESVNLASRLESSALPGGVQISESAYERLRHLYPIEVHRQIDLKGIGLTTVYLLLPPTAPPPPPLRGQAALASRSL